MPIKMETVPELPEIKSEIKAEDFIVNSSVQVASTTDNNSPLHQPTQAGTPNNLVDSTHHQLQNASACGWVGKFLKLLSKITLPWLSN